MGKSRIVLDSGAYIRTLGSLLASQEASAAAIARILVMQSATTDAVQQAIIPAMQAFAAELTASREALSGLLRVVADMQSKLDALHARPPAGTPTH